MPHRVRLGGVHRPYRSERYGQKHLLRTIAGLSRPLAGHITVNGRRTDEMSRREIAATIAFVSTEEVKVENLKVSDVVALGRAPYTNWVAR